MVVSEPWLPKLFRRARLVPGGLEVLCQNRGVIFNATSRLQWPGAASVIASVLHVRFVENIL